MQELEAAKSQAQLQYDAAVVKLQAELREAERDNNLQQATVCNQLVEAENAALRRHVSELTGDCAECNSERDQARDELRRPIIGLYHKFKDRPIVGLL